MKHIDVAPDQLELSADLTRSGSAKSFEERLRASIDQIGLVEPLKVAEQPEGGYLVIDGALRLRAIRAIRERSPERFETVPAYLLDYERRFEIRYQSDIYQDLLPSQMAAFVEHLHRSEGVRKADIARFIGVSPATLRNYTGLWRLLQRGGLFAMVVELMDLDVLPASNPYAWLRLTPDGLRKVLTEDFAGGQRAEAWVDSAASAARKGNPTRFPLKFVQAATDRLAPEFYREGQDVRIAKRDLGLRKTKSTASPKRSPEHQGALRQLRDVTNQSSSPILRSAAAAFEEYLQ